MDDAVLSVVTGTYNRLSHMRKMVASTRKSIGIGIPYEIVLVDGGSTDGTIEWCKTQSDIVLIEQGELLGAVKAFNAGMGIAKGTYVVIANDDIEFIDESMVYALAFMQDNPDVGVGCFWQDRGGREWHLEYQPAVLDGQQVNHIYGQVCIVPTWLGNKVGWWGDYLHTYGGDNELSSRIMELGYKVRGVPGACIHDFQIEDELRRINMRIYSNPAQAAAAGRPHNDSVTWGLRWTHRDGSRLVGPVIKHEPAMPNPVGRKTRVFYAPIYEPGYEVQKIAKCGLRNAFVRAGCLTYEYDYMGVCSSKGKKFGIDYMHDLANAHKPDIFVLQVQNAGEFDAEVLYGLRIGFPKAVFVCWNGDYHPKNLYDEAYMAMLQYFHLTGLVTTNVAAEYDAKGLGWFYWQIGFEESDAMPNAGTPKHDIVFLANGYSPARIKLAEFLLTTGYTVGLYGSWPSHLPSGGSTLYDFDAGCKLYRAAKFAISDSQWPHAAGFVSNRMFQAMSAGGALFMQQYFDGMGQLIGVRDKEHVVVWHNHKDLLDSIRYYTEHENERAEIAACGTDFVKKHHSFDVRVEELFAELKVRNIWPKSQ